MDSMFVIKRNGMEVPFNADKIKKAISGANQSVAEEQRMSEYMIQAIAHDVTDDISRSYSAVSVEDIQDMVENYLIKYGMAMVAKQYIRYRYKHQMKRRANTTDDGILSIIELNNEEIKQENSNKNPFVASTQRDYMAGEVSKDLCERLLVPEDVWEAHKNGLIHFHDSDYFAQTIFNCCLINLEDMLQNGTVISETMLERPHSFQTACNVATQIVAQVASNQYGGQTVSLAHLAPFVDVSRQRYRIEVRKELESEGIEADEEKINSIAEKRVRKEIQAGIQTIQYQVITLMTTNGQAPFITVNMYLNEVKDERTKEDLALCIEEVLSQRIKGVKNEKGVWITPAFPKLIYVLEEDNVRPGTRFWELTKLAAKCTAKRMVPDYVSEKKMKEYKIGKTGAGSCYPPMGCRSFLTPDRTKGNTANALNYKDGEEKYYGRFNQGVVTLNLPDVALSSKGDMDAFWAIMEERLELCHKALRCRHERLLGTISDVSPIHWQHGAIARLQKGEKIDKLLYGGYSTISLGYAGLYECVRYMTKKSHTDEDAKPFALAVMQKLNDACAAWKAAEDIDYSVYGTPLESTTYKFAKCLKKRFGIIEGVTDRNYITNSYHVHVTEPIDAFTKLQFEADFQKLSPGGAISYVETPNLEGNIDAVIALMQFIYDTIVYAELNTKSDYCHACGFTGEIEITECSKKLIWRCPNCGNTNQDKMNVARRTCGYIGTQFWNQGRTQEIRERVLHL